jgi:hypothetical protein
LGSYELRRGVSRQPLGRKKMIDILLVIVSIFLFAIAIWLFNIARSKFGKITDGTLYSIGGIGGINRIVNYYAPKYMTRYVGNGKIPIKAFEGDSKNILIDLKQSISTLLSMEDNIIPFGDIILNTKDGLLISVNVNNDNNLVDELEFELIAAGFIVEGDKKQKQSTTLMNLHYEWNCYFPNTGNHSFIIVIRVLRNGVASDIGRISQIIKVVKVDGLTKGQVSLLSSIAGLISGISALLEIFHRFGIF